VLAAVVAATKAGASTVALCKLGDELILKETAAVYNKKVEGKTVDKGVGFPTCVSLNSIVCHNSPLASDPEELIQDGDVVKMCVAVP
jgi:methionine aminopeptidase